MNGPRESRASAPGVVAYNPGLSRSRTAIGSTGRYHQEDSDYEEGEAVDQESREAIEKSFEIICKCFVPQNVDGDDALARAQAIDSEAEARLDAFGSSRSCLHSDLEWDWAWMRSPGEDCQETINEEDARRQTSNLKRLLQRLRASKVYKDEAFNNELANIDEIAAADVKIESDRFMKHVLKRVAFRFRYKQRWHVGKAVHILVLQSDPTVAKVLLRKLREELDIDIAHRCTNDTFGRLASVLPIHLAAGGSHVDMLNTIIELRADINAKTTLSERDGNSQRDHYTALHEACFFQRSKAAEILIAGGAEIDCKNMFGDTPLHVAAKLAPPLAQKLADVLVKNRANVMVVNDKKLRPVDVAIDECNFPLRDLRLLVDYGLDDLVRVAKQSAVAAGEMMRDPSSDDWEYKVDRSWRRRLDEEAKVRDDVCQVWCRLMEYAPQAAESLLEALTLEPRVQDKLLHPLPRVAFLRSDKIFRSHYISDRQWVYTRDKTPQYPAWHRSLAPQQRPSSATSCLGKDTRDKTRAIVEIKVLSIPNMICPEVFLRLQMTTHLHIFTKIAVRSIIEHVWRTGVATFYFAELGLKSVVIMILLWWVLRPPGGFWARATWSCLFASACRELCYELVELRGYLRIAGGGKPSMRFINCWLTLDNVFDLSTSSLLFWLLVHLWGTVDADSLASIREMFAVVVLARWLQLVYAFRAFPSVGTKLIPILQSVSGMGGILPLTVSAFIAFWHAFCALGAPDGTYSNLIIDSVRFLFVGDGYGIDMVLGLGDGSVGAPSPWAVMMLISAIFFFCILLMNIFIATTDQAYEQSLELVHVRFLQERAAICFECFFRFRLPCHRSLTSGQSLSILLFLILPAWLGMLNLEQIPLWATSSIFTVLIVFLESAMVHIPWSDPHRKESPEDHEEPMGSTETWASKATSISRADGASDSKSTPDMPGVVDEQQSHLPVVPSRSTSAVPLPGSPLSVSPPPGNPSKQLPPSTVEGMYLWICHREDCNEFDLWPSARSADCTSVRLEGRVSNLKRESMMRGRKTDRDILDLKQCMEYRLARIEEQLSRRDGEASNSAGGAGH